MALSTEHKLYIGVGILAVLGIAAYVQSTQNAKEEASYSPESANAELPKIEITEADTKAINKIEITKPGDEEADDEDDKKPLTVVLEKKGEEDWELKSPVKAKANAANIKSLLGNLEKLEVQDRIASGKDTYEKYEVSDKKALHAVFFKGDGKVADLYFGKKGGRGQMTRVGATEGVYAVKGYSEFVYKRDLKGWRDRTIFKFDDKKVKTVELVREEVGTFSFERNADTWKGTFAEPKKKAKEIERFDAKKVDDLIRAYKSLNADDFGDDKKKSDVGLVEPLSILTITLEDGAKRILKVGDNSKDESRWAMKNGSDQIFSIAAWSANWAVSDVEKFQKKEDDEDEDEDDDGPPPMMPMPPGGH